MARARSRRLTPSQLVLHNRARGSAGLGPLRSATSAQVARSRAAIGSRRAASPAGAHSSGT